MAKTCVGCGETKSLELFPKHKKMKDGRLGKCKACVKIYHARYYEDNKDRITALSRQWFKNNRGRATASHTEWVRKHPEKAAERAAEWRRKNPEKQAARSLEWKKANPEQVKQAAALYREKNPETGARNKANRRAKITQTGGELTKGLWGVLFEQQEGKCFCCGVPLEKGKIHLDHWVPLALGGPNADSNMRLLTDTCNLRKGSLHPEAYLLRRQLELI